MLPDESGAFPQVKRLFDAFQKGPGVFGKTRENMPEYFHLRRVPLEDRVNVLTVTAAWTIKPTLIGCGRRR